MPRHLTSEIYCKMYKIFDTDSDTDADPENSQRTFLKSTRQIFTLVFFSLHYS